jgi:hypothetical protein
MCGSIGEEVADEKELPDIARRGSSSTVRVANVELSNALVVTSTDLKSPKVKSEIRHSVFTSETGSLDRADDRDGDDVSLAAELGRLAGPPNREEVGRFSAREWEIDGIEFKQGLAAQRTNRRMDAFSGSPPPRAMTRIDSPEPRPSSPAKST